MMYDVTLIGVYLLMARLAKDLIQVTQLKAEPWIAMGHFCNMTNRKPRAVYFAQKVQYASAYRFKQKIVHGKCTCAACICKSCFLLYSCQINKRHSLDR